jgi:hypothetical protein
MYEVAIALGLLSAGIIILAHALEAIAPDRNRASRPLVPARLQQKGYLAVSLWAKGVSAATA